ncbi:hypothetical protein [Streptomyces brevispora]|uniref:Uncharacterized protein n=1 Tax=Streptomyces brevispora TaxID=887462 RepID=A0ABZ1FXI5_9ACTN|nr:hypothetical protein [Streptomyces brevispora]WSC11669.1 hypothetical protein OIE64_01470 [Streptomyces brevispora]
MAGVLISEDSNAWSIALRQGALGGLLVGVVLAGVIATSNTLHARRTASRHGLTLSPDAAAGTRTTVFRASVPVGTTAYQLTDSVLHALKQAPFTRIDEVQEFTHGKLSLVCASSLANPVKLSISIETDQNTATVTMEARPVSTWKRLDGGASWSVLTAAEPHVRGAVHPDAGGTSTA